MAELNTPTADKDKPKRYRAEDVRQGAIILRTPFMRAIFIGGLAGAIVLALALALFAR